MQRLSPFALAAFVLSSCETGPFAGFSSDLQSAAQKEQQDAGEKASPAAAHPTDAMAEIGAVEEQETLNGLAGSYLASRAALGEADFAVSAQFLQEALAKDPENGALTERVCLLYVMGGDVEKSFSLAQAWRKNSPQAVVPNLILLLDAAKRGDWQNSDAFLKTLEGSKINRLTLPLLRAWIEAAQGKFEAAEKTLLPLYDMPQAGTVAMMHAAFIREFAADVPGAVALYQKTLKNFPEPPLRLVMAAGHLFERAGDIDAAKKLYQDFGKRSPHNYLFEAAYRRMEQGELAPATIRDANDGIAHVLFDIAVAFEGQQTNESAIVYAQLSRFMQGDMPFNQLLLAEIFENYDRFTRAAEIHERLLKLPEFYWSAGLRLARNFEKMNRSEDAIAVLESMRQKFPGRIEAASMLGDLYRNAKDFESAIIAYSDAIKAAEPHQATDWPLFYARGVAFERAKDWSKAEADFKKSLELSPDQPYVLNYLAYSWVEKNQNLKEAEKMLIRAVELAPDDGFIVDSLGWAYYRMGDYQKAEPLLQRAVELRPFDAQLIDHYGDVLWKMEKIEQARIQWQRALSFDPDAALRSNIEKKLKNGLAEEKA